MGTATLNGSGQAALTISIFSVAGSYFVFASYRGDSNYNSSPSPILVQQVVTAAIPALDRTGFVAFTLLLAGIGILYIRRTTG